VTGSPAEPSDSPAERADPPAEDADRGATGIDLLDRIEQLSIELVRAAPALDPAVIDELVHALRRVGSALARSLARVIELVGEQLIDPGIALPAIAMACATLADGVRGKLGARELEAARFEIETLMPVPDRPAPIHAPDVPVSSLRKRP